MGLKKKIYLLLSVFILLAIQSCRQSKYVGEGEYLYIYKKIGILKKLGLIDIRKSTIHFESIDKDSNTVYSSSDEYISSEELQGIIKLQPNRSFYLFVYNRIDSTKMNQQIKRKRDKVNRINKKRISKQNEVNKSRNDKAKIKEDTHYFQKIKRLKKSKKGWRHWIATNIGEAPVLMDSLKVNKSVEQLKLYLKSKGFYESTIHDTIRCKEKRRKAYVSFTVNPGKPYKINTIKFDENPEYSYSLKHEYSRMVRKEKSVLKEGDLLDHNLLDAEREKFSKFCRDNAYFDFSKSYIYFEVDTIGKDHLADITIRIIDRKIEGENGEQKTLLHSTYKVTDVTYYVHNKDLASFKNYEAYKSRLNTFGLDDFGGNYPLLDTLHYVDSVFVKKFVFFGPYSDTIVYRGTFIFN